MSHEFYYWHNFYNKYHYDQTWVYDADKWLKEGRLKPLNGKCNIEIQYSVYRCMLWKDYLGIGTSDTFYFYLIIFVFPKVLYVRVIIRDFYTDRFKHPNWEPTVTSGWQINSAQLRYLIRFRAFSLYALDRCVDIAFENEYVSWPNLEEFFEL